MLCGSKLVDREPEEVRNHLAHVRWLLNEVPTWDDSLAPDAVRRALGEFYGRQQSLLNSTLDQPTTSAATTIPSPAPAGERQGEGKPLSSQTVEVGLAGSSLLIGTSDVAKTSAASEALRALTRNARAKNVEQNEQNVGAQNVVAQNSVENVVARSAIAQNTVEPDAVAQNTIAQNAHAQNALAQNAVSQNAVSQNAVSRDLSTQNVALSADFPSPQPSPAGAGEGAPPSADQPGAREAYANSVADSDALRTLVAKSSASTEPKKPIILARKPRGPSPWVTLIKPVLHESLGWFLGAFLILAGALYLIADAWGDMTSTTRALTVFGLVEVWAVGFALWAAALSRKPTTRAASASLRRIAALVAPLSVLALGPALSSPFAWVALAAGSGIAAFLTFRAAKDLEESGAMLAGSVLLATACVGLAPILPVGSGWAVIIPSLFAAWGFARGPRSNTSTTWTAAIAWLLPLALMATRFLLMRTQLDFTVAGLVASTALLAGFSLKLTAPDAPSRGVISIVSLTALFFAFAVSFFVPKPACVVVCLLAAWTTMQHAQGGKPGGNRIWWLSGTYLFSFLAWQRIDQLVPPIVWTWWNALKISLGYAAASMPASYGAVYQAIFIAIGAVIAAVHFTRTNSRGAHVWLRTSSIAAALSGLLAMASVSTDARPALVALPLLAASMFGVGIVARRRDALFAGAGLTALLALVLQQKFTSGLPVMALALACAVGAVAFSLGSRTTKRLNRTTRLTLAGTTLFISALVTLVAVTQQGTDTFIALCGSSLAAIVAARFVHRRILAAALFTTIAIFVRLHSPFVMGVAALLLALVVLVPRIGRRFQPATALTYALTFIAPAWAFALTSGELLFGTNQWPVVPLGITSLLAAATCVVLARSKPGVGLAFFNVKPSGARALLDGAAIVLLVNAVIPWSSNAGLFPEWGTVHAQAALALFALVASVHAVVRGRSVQGVMLASLASMASFAIAGASFEPSGMVVWAWPALVLALSTAALLPSITVPLSALFAAAAVQGDPTLMLVLSVACAALALSEELDLTWNFVLNRAHIAWAASLTSALLFIGALFFSAHGAANPVVLVLAVALPLVWMRATRQGFMAAAAIPLFALATTVALPGALSFTPILAVLLTRALTWNRVRTLIGLPELKRGAKAPGGDGVGEGIEGLAFVGAATFTALLSIVTNRGLEAPWAAALLVMGGGAGVLRVTLAACLAGLNPALRPMTVGGLVGVAALVHHAPRALRTMIGSRSVAWLEITTLVLAIAGAVLSVLGAESVPQLSPLTFSVAVAVAIGAGLLATFSRAWAGSARTVRYPSAIVACLATGLAVAALPITLLVPAVLLIAAVLLGAPVLLSIAGVTLGLDLVATLHAGHPVLGGSALLIALVLAGLSLALRFTRVDAVASTWLRKLGRDTDWSRASALFWPALTLCAMSLPSMAFESWPVLFLPLAVLLVTPRRHEQGAALSVLALATLWLFPAPVITVCFALGALTLATLGRFVEHRLTALWRVSAWLFAFVGIVAAGIDPGSWTVPFAWLAAVGVTWLQVGHTSTGRGWAWGATGVGVHVVMAYVGVRLSTGAPMVLIFPWWAAGSAALALLRHFRGGARSATAFSMVSLVELMCGVVLLHSAQPREAVLSVLVAIALVFIAWRRVVESDDSLNAWFGQFALVGGALAARVLGSGAMPGLTEAWVLLGASAVFAGLSQFLKREGRPAAGGVLSIGAWAWPAVGALLVPWTQWTAASIWLVGVSLLAAWISRTTARRAGTLVSAGAINAALVLAAIGMGFSEWHLLLVPFGLTLLTLAWLFRDEVSVRSQILLRAWGMGFVYAAMAWKPLTANSVGALVLCVTVCLAGVALGALWRIRSYVLLGSGVVVTTVLATLVRSGLAEPRLGAVFLSLLGLLVVVVMVLITTKRDELRERMASMQRVMATWSP